MCQWHDGALPTQVCAYFRQQYSDTFWKFRKVPDVQILAVEEVSCFHPLTRVSARLGLFRNLKIAFGVFGV